MTEDTAGGTREPDDADARRRVAPVVCYPPETLPPVDLEELRERRASARLAGTLRVAPRD